MLLAFIGGVTSVAVLSRGMKLSDAIIGVLSSLSQIASSFIYCFADEAWMLYLGNMELNILSPFSLRHNLGRFTFST